MGTPLTDLLLEQGKLDPERLERARRLQAETGERLDTVLIRLGLVAERDVGIAHAAQLGLPITAPGEYPDAPVLQDRVSVAYLRHARVAPLSEDQDRIVVAMADPLDQFALQALALAVGKPVTAQVGVASEIEAALERQYPGSSGSMAQIADDIRAAGSDADYDDIQHLKDLASEAPIIRLVNMIITRAVQAGASDVHVEPFEHALKVRYRIDGALRDMEAPPPRHSAAIISRIKVMAGLDIAERRIPQDGRIRMRIDAHDVDLRICTAPTLHGESVVMRILDKRGLLLEFSALGFDPVLQSRMETLLDVPQGITLVTGPTGSGKTTTLYAALHRLNTPEEKIITIEDPVEYQIPGINQIQVRPGIGFGFSNALRSILRQDPDVIMVGEMRDAETAQIAVQAALTGHRVLSTLHTNDAAGSITRLLDMGVEDYLLASTVTGVVAQRLVRTLCRRCKAPFDPPPGVVERLGLDRVADRGSVTLFRAVGCEVCDGSGYQGRTTILEILVMSGPLRDAVLRSRDTNSIRAAAVGNGMTTMLQHGVAKALAGATTLEEILRAVQED